jgi:hypothetical protein
LAFLGSKCLMKRKHFFTSFRKYLSRVCSLPSFMEHFCVFWDRASLCISSWPLTLYVASLPWTLSPLASASQVPRLQMWGTIPSFQGTFWGYKDRWMQFLSYTYILIGNTLILKNNKMKWSKNCSKDVSTVLQETSPLEAMENLKLKCSSVWSDHEGEVKMAYIYRHCIFHEEKRYGDTKDH